MVKGKITLAQNIRALQVPVLLILGLQGRSVFQFFAFMWWYVQVLATSHNWTRLE